jgi:Domain of Unknown Function (DUF1080)
MTTSPWTDLFDGQTLSGWTAPGGAGGAGGHHWRVAGAVRVQPEDERRFRIEPGTGLFVNGDEGRTTDLRTVAEHGSCELHLEFCVPRGSNSGVYLQGQYEIQILDSFGTPDADLKYGSCGGIYARWVEATRTPYDGAPPRTNASRPPGEWQELDVLFSAPRFGAQGECSGPTRGAWNEVDIPRGPLRLQGDHGPVAFRNLRLRALD